MRALLTLLLAAFLLSVLLPAATMAAPPRNIILIGWDGAQRNHVKECLGRGELPALQALAAEGALVAIDITRTTDTKSGWTQILTGYEPEVTGVFSNSRYQAIPAGLSVFERLEQHFGPDQFVTVAVIGKKGHVDADPEKRVPIGADDQYLRPRAQRRQGTGVASPDAQPVANATRAASRQARQQREPGSTVVVENGQRYRVTPAKPYFYTQEALDVWQNGLGENDNVGAKALEYLEQYKNRPFFFFVHFADVDHKGHAAGENSKEYNDALISCDTWTGRIVQKLKDLGLYDQTMVYVTADHGFDEGQKGHQDAPYVFLATNDKGVIRNGERADITPTILDRFGLDLAALQPPLDGHSLLRPYQKPVW